MEFQLVSPAKGRAELPQLKLSADQRQHRGARCEATRQHKALVTRVTQAALLPPDQQLLRTAAAARQPAGRESLPGELLPSASMQGIGAKWEVNWNESLMAWNEAAPLPQQSEPCSLACPWVSSSHPDQPSERQAFPQEHTATAIKTLRLDSSAARNPPL